VAFQAKIGTPTVDIRAFTMILSEIVVGGSAEQGCGSSGIPSFVFAIIENGESTDLKAQPPMTCKSKTNNRELRWIITVEPLPAISR
jgi:hypothetical protein